MGTYKLAVVRQKAKRGLLSAYSTMKLLAFLKNLIPFFEAKKKGTKPSYCTLKCN